MRQLQILTIFLIAAALNSCNNIRQLLFGSEAAIYPYATSEISAIAPTDGTWMFPCNAVEEFQTQFHLSKSLSISKDQILRKELFWMDANCKKLSFKLESQGSLILSAQLDSSTYHVAHNIHTFKLTILDEHLTYYFNFTNFCGKSNWKKGVKYKMNPEDCPQLKDRNNRISGVYISREGSLSGQELRFIDIKEKKSLRIANEIYRRSTLQSAGF